MSYDIYIRTQFTSVFCDIPVAFVLQLTPANLLEANDTLGPNPGSNQQQKQEKCDETASEGPGMKSGLGTGK